MGNAAPSRCRLVSRNTKGVIEMRPSFVFKARLIALFVAMLSLSVLSKSASAQISKHPLGVGVLNVEIGGDV
jgi:hypothetical protein